MDTNVQGDREYVMIRRKVEAMIIGDSLQLGDATIKRMGSRHYVVNTGRGTTADWRTRRSTLDFIDRVTMSAIALPVTRGEE